MARKRILVAGGGGLVGSHLCRRLLGRGYEVICLDRAAGGELPGLRDVADHPSFVYFRHDTARPLDMEVSQIYDLVSPVSAGDFLRRPVEALWAGVSGSLNLLELARRNNADYLYASSGDVYASARAAANGEESGAPPAADNLAADIKRTGESLCRAYIAQYGVRVRVARIFNTYGPGTTLSDRRVVPLFVMNALQNRDIVIYGSGMQTRTFCWAEDTADGLMRMMERQEPHGFDPINIGSGRETTILSLAERVVALAGSRSRIVHLPARHGDLRQKTPEISKARRLLGWEPTVSLDDGLARTVGYFHGLLTSGASRCISWAEMI